MLVRISEQERHGVPRRRGGGGRSTFSEFRGASISPLTRIASTMPDERCTPVRRTDGQRPPIARSSVRTRSGRRIPDVRYDEVVRAHARETPRSRANAPRSGDDEEVGERVHRASRLNFERAGAEGSAHSTRTCGPRSYEQNIDRTVRRMRRQGAAGSPATVAI